MRILAIDPGFDRLGVAILERKNNKETLLYSNCFQTSSKDTYALRLKLVADELERLISDFKPSVCALEALFFAKNQQTAIDVAGSRGVCIYIAEKHAMEVYEYTPLQIKIAVTGYGKSDKSQVTDMVQRLISIEKEKAVDDEYDAIAVGLTCMATERF
jgi:crossover junction endodeoxyribonuclease RuvC